MNETRVIGRIFGKTPVKLRREPLVDDNGITNRIAFAKDGVLRYSAEFSDGSVKQFVGKHKSSRIIAKGIRMLSGNDLRLFLLLVCSHKIFGYNRSAVREAALYEHLAQPLKVYLPNILGTAAGCFHGGGFVAMEEFPTAGSGVQALYRMVDAIAAIHAQYYGDSTCVRTLGLNCYAAGDYQRIRHCLKCLFDKLSAENHTCFGADKIAVLHRFISRIHTEYAKVEKRRTLTHNDYSVRNIYADEKRICIYDWELACYQNPEHDILELLISVMTDMHDDEVVKVLQYYRNRLSELTGVILSEEEHAAALRFNVLEYCVNKLSLLRHAGQYLGLAYPEQLARNASRMMEILQIH